MSPSTPNRSHWLGPGLFSATLATLLLETLDARLLSVLTWYHLSFFAVSLAMLANVLSRQVGRQVVDRTGITDYFDFTLEFSGDARSGAALCARVLS